MASLDVVRKWSRQFAVISINNPSTPCLPSHSPQAELTLRREHRSMRFIFVHAAEAQALEAIRQWGARLLQPGQALQWTELSAQSCFVLAGL